MSFTETDNDSFYSDNSIERRLERMDIPLRIQDICRRLLMDDPQLTELYLGGKGLRDRGAIALAQCLKHNTTVRLLYLCFNQIGNVGATALAQMLLTNTSLQVLRLEGNIIGNQAAKAFRATLQENRTITKLYLYKNIIGPAGASDLAEGLEHNSHLQVLDLYGNRLGDDGAKALGHMLQSRNQKLTELMVGGNAITSQGVIDLAQGLAQNKHLKVLDLRLNGIGNDGCKAIAELLVVNQTLQAVWLQHNEITAEGISVLVKDGLSYNYHLPRLFLGQFHDSALMAELEYYLKLNRSGRYILQKSITTPNSLWPHVLAKFKKEPETVFYFVQNNPHLFKG